MPADETQVSWQDYLTVIYRRRWFFAIPCAVIVAVTMVVGFCLPKIYRAETILLMQDPKVLNPLIQGMAVSSPVERQMRVVEQELLGWTSLSRLVRELGMDAGVTTPLAFERLINDLRDDIVVTTRNKSLIVLAYSNPDPELAQRVLNTVSTIYVTRNVEAGTAEAETAIRFIQSEMEVYQTKLEESERALREFKELYSMDMPVAATLNNQIINLEVMLAKLLVENTEQHPTVMQAKRQISDLKRRRNEEIKRVITAAVAQSQSPEIYQDLVKVLDVPTDEAGPVTPKVQAAREAYQAWVDRLDTPMIQQVGKAQLMQVGQPGQVPRGPGAVTAGMGQAGQPIKAISEDRMLSFSLAPRQEQELSRLTRDYDVHSKTYQEMKQRLERAKITQRLGQSDEETKFKIIEPARLPVQPTSPKLWLWFFGSLVIGICAGIGAAFAAEYLDRSLQTAEEAAELLGVPTLGSISRIVTEEDVTIRRHHFTQWASPTPHLHRLWAGIDKTLLQWGL